MRVPWAALARNLRDAGFRPCEKCENRSYTKNLSGVFGRLPYISYHVCPICAPFVPHLCPISAPFLLHLSSVSAWIKFGNAKAAAASSASSVCILVHPPPPALVESPSWHRNKLWMAYLVGAIPWYTYHPEKWWTSSMGRMTSHIYGKMFETTKLFFCFPHYTCPQRLNDVIHDA